MSSADEKSGWITVNDTKKRNLLAKNSRLLANQKSQWSTDSSRENRYWNHSEKSSWRNRYGARGKDGSQPVQDTENHPSIRRNTRHRDTTECSFTGHTTNSSTKPQFTILKRGQRIIPLFSIELDSQCDFPDLGGERRVSQSSKRSVTAWNRSAKSAPKSDKCKSVVSRANAASAWPCGDFPPSWGRGCYPPRSKAEDGDRVRPAVVEEDAKRSGNDSSPGVPRPERSTGGVPLEGRPSKAEIKLRKTERRELRVLQQRISASRDTRVSMVTQRFLRRSRTGHGRRPFSRLPAPDLTCQQQYPSLGEEASDGQPPDAAKSYSSSLRQVPRPLPPEPQQPQTPEAKKVAAAGSVVKKLTGTSIEFDLSDFLSQKIAAATEVCVPPVEEEPDTVIEREQRRRKPSASLLPRRGKTRLEPKPKKPSRLKRLILAERARRRLALSGAISDSSTTGAAVPDGSLVGGPDCITDGHSGGGSETNTGLQSTELTHIPPLSSPTEEVQVSTGVSQDEQVEPISESSPTEMVVLSSIYDPVEVIELPTDPGQVVEINSRLGSSVRDANVEAHDRDCMSSVGVEESGRSIQTSANHIDSSGSDPASTCHHESPTVNPASVSPVISALQPLTQPITTVQERVQQEDGVKSKEEVVSADTDDPVSRGEEYTPRVRIDAKRLIHSNRFRDYCQQILRPEINSTARTLLQDLCRFQERQYLKDPSKAKARRRLVFGLKEVNKHLSLDRLKCILIAPDIQNIETEGGLNTIVLSLLSSASLRSVPIVVALKRRALGGVCKKPVAVSCVGILNYQGSEDNFKELMVLTEQAQEEYKVKLEAAERSLQPDNSAEILVGASSGTIQQQAGSDGNSNSQPSETSQHPPTDPCQQILNKLKQITVN